MRNEIRIPYHPMSKELVYTIPRIFEALRKYKLDWFELVIEEFDADQMAEIVAYGGFPSTYPHWSFGQEYDEYKQGYDWGMTRVYELVVNNEPTYMYLLNSNSLTDNINVIAHATAHSDFFKNNIHFSHTNRSMMNNLANYGQRIRNVSNKFGAQEVEDLLDVALAVRWLIDPLRRWVPDKVLNDVFEDEVFDDTPDLLKIDPGKSYLERFINPDDFVSYQKEQKRKQFNRRDRNQFPDSPTKEVFGFLIDHSPLKWWQKTVLTFIHKESQYMIPQGQTKICNEGWASYMDLKIMAEEGLAKDSGIIEYAKHKAGVIGGKHSLNPYALGMMLLHHIEDKWNKGQFGKEWEDCTTIEKWKHWDKKTMQGHEKVLEVRKYYDDVQLIATFMDQHFIEKYEVYEWEYNVVTRQYVIKSRDLDEIRKIWIERMSNMGLPLIEVINGNGLEKGVLFLQHKYDGRELEIGNTERTLLSIYYLWKAPVALRTSGYANADGECYVYCGNGKDVGYCPLPDIIERLTPYIGEVHV